MYLDCEGEGWKEESFWTQFLTSYKAYLLNQLAVIYSDSRHEYEKAIFIWEKILKWLKESKVSLSDRYSASMTAISNLSACYGVAGRLNECLQICDEGIQLCMNSGRGVKLGKFLVNKAEALSLTGGAEEETCRRYARQAYYLDDLMGPKKSLQYADQYYRKTYEINIQWY